jgi:hypothetical protein
LWDLTNRDQPRLLAPPLTDTSEFAFLGGFLGGQTNPVFSADGHTLDTANGNGNGTVLWDLTDRNQPRQLGLSFMGPTVFSPDGHTLATAGTVSRDLTDRTLSEPFETTAVILWDLTPLEELRRNAVRVACARAGGPLNKATWEVYAPGVNYQDTCAGQ